MQQHRRLSVNKTRRERPAARQAGATALWLGLLLLWGSLHAQTPAGFIQGRVVNGTTSRPVASGKVELILLQQGMIPMGTASTDREGRFRFENVERPGDAPAMLRIEYQGATYSQPLLPQQSADDVEIRVYEASPEPGLVSVQEQAIFLHPSGDTLVVLEHLLFENRSQPPKTYVSPQGTYPFTLPGTPRDGVQVSVTGPAGMPVSQTATPGKQPNSFSIAYPFRPGETQVRLEYTLDYQPPFEFSKPLDLPAERTYVVTPGEEVQVSGENLVSEGAEPSTGYIGYRVTPAGNVIRLQVSGQAPVRSAQTNAESAGESGGLVTIPDPLNRWRWVILGAAALVMLAGFVYHCRH